MPSLLLLISGLVLVLAPAFISNGALEEALTGMRGPLAWGPALFRALVVFHGLVLIAAAILGRRSEKAGSDGPPPPYPRWPWVVMTALTIAGLALRLWRLNTCLWLDEVFTLTDFARPPLGTILTSFPNQNQHMLYSILSHLSLQAFGENAWALRLPSVFFGIGSLWALFLLGRRLSGDKEALLACALMTFSYHHIWFSQNARGYMGLLFFSILATWLWLEALERPEWRRWVFYAVACALGIWIHMTMIFVVATHGLIWLVFLLKRGRQEARAGWMPLAAWILCGTLSLQMHALVLPEFFRTAVHEVSMQSEWTNPLWVVAESLRSLRIGFSGIVVLLCGGVMVLAGWLSLFRQHPRAALAMVLPGLIGGGSMLALSHNLWPRFFFFCMGFALLVVIRGAIVLPSIVLAPFRTLFADRKLQEVMSLTLAGLIIMASAATVPRCYALPKQDFTGARDFAERMRGPGDAIVTVGMVGHVYKRYYAPHWQFATSAGELEALRKVHSNVSLVYSLPIELKAFHPEVWKVVEQDFEVVRAFPGTLGGGEVYVCRERRPLRVSR